MRCSPTPTWLRLSGGHCPACGNEILRGQLVHICARRRVPIWRRVVRAVVDWLRGE